MLSVSEQIERVSKQVSTLKEKIQENDYDEEVYSYFL
ncbi:MAG: hypothetical protein K940chlam3_01123 [Chlamydiae bacterium]|nr:hypothetical protein [Chlamydiota bacterium]